MASTRSDGWFSTQTPMDTLNRLETESSTSIKATTSSNNSLILIYALASVIIIGLCIVVGLAAAVVCRVKVMKRQRNSTVETDSCRVSDVNQEYYEIVDTIYETINTSDDLANFGMQVKMTNNDAYTENRRFCSSMGINATNNEAYCYVTNVVPMKENSSYQAAQLLHSPNVARDLDHSEKQYKLLDGSGSENPCISITTDHEQ